MGDSLLILVIVVPAGLFIIWFGSVMLRYSNARQKFDKQIAAEGIDIEAEIVNHRVSIGRKGASYYFITYQFTPAGQSQAVTQETAVSGKNYRQLNVGNHIQIRYLPSDPKSVLLGPGIREMFGADVMRLNGMIGVGIGIATIIFGIVITGVFAISQNTKAATATAQTLRLSATPDTAQKTATVVVATATAEADQQLANKLRDSSASRIPIWKKVTDQTMHRILPPETDLNMREVEIDYGYCANNAFYLYVWTKITDRLRIGDEIDTFVEGYGYVDSSMPPKCYPKELSQVWLRNGGSLGNDWYTVSGAYDVKVPSN